MQVYVEEDLIGYEIVHGIAQLCSEIKMASGDVCEHFLKGRCRFGNSCKFLHPGSVTRGSSQLQGNYGSYGPGSGGGGTGKVCSYFMNGTCKFGNDCKFSHPVGMAGGRQGGGRGGGGQFNRHQGDPSLDLYNSGANNSYQTFSNYNSRNANSFGPGNKGGVTSGDVLFQNTSQIGNGNSGRRQVRFNNNAPQVHLYSEQGAGYHGNQDVDQSGSVIRRPLFANSQAGWSSKQPTMAAAQPQTPAEVMDVVRQDMKEWEMGKMWPLSSYSYALSTHTLPGLKDYHPEELRAQAYVAMGTGQLPTHSQQVNQLLQEAREWRGRYGNITLQETSHIMERMKFGSRDGNITIESSGPVFLSPSVANPAASPFKPRSDVGLSTSLSNPQSTLLSTPTAPPPTGGMGDEELMKRYSLSAEDLLAYKSREFVLGKIPVQPPPPELCR